MLLNSQVPAPSRLAHPEVPQIRRGELRPGAQAEIAREGLHHGGVEHWEALVQHHVENSDVGASVVLFGALGQGAQERPGAAEVIDLVFQSRPALAPLPIPHLGEEESTPRRGLAPHLAAQVLEEVLGAASGLENPSISSYVPLERRNSSLLGHFCETGNPSLKPLRTQVFESTLPQNVVDFHQASSSSGLVHCV